MAYFHARRTLASSMIRALSSSSSPSFSSSSSSSSIASRSRFAFAILTKQTPLVPHSLKFSIRFQTSGSDDSPKDESSKTNPSKGPSKDAVILAGCDLQHWLIIMEFPKDKKTSEEEMVNTYVKTLAQVVGSEEEAKKKIYSVSTVTYTGFGAEISEELSKKVKGLPGVLWVLPDSYMDVPNKDYGGDLFVDGKVIPRPKYRHSQSQPADNKPGQKNDRRRETFQKEGGIPTRKPNRTRGQRE